MDNQLNCHPILCEMISFVLILILISIQFCVDANINRPKRQAGTTIFLGLKVGFLKGILAGQAFNPYGSRGFGGIGGGGFGGFGGVNGGNPFLGRNSRVTERMYEFVRSTYDDEREREDIPPKTTPKPWRYPRTG